MSNDIMGRCCRGGTTRKADCACRFCFAWTPLVPASAAPISTQSGAEVDSSLRRRLLIASKRPLNPDADVCREAAQAVSRDEVLEEAARICDEDMGFWNEKASPRAVIKRLAARIRAAKEKR